MAIIKKLSLAAGGGIISRGDQSDQQPNTATLLIGLGGTGVDAIRTIKTQVYDRLKPDNIDASVAEYSHIRFLGVDSDITNVNVPSTDAKLTLDTREFFSIASENLDKEGAITDIAIKDRKELSWISKGLKKINFDGRGAGGTRQIGRFLLMDKSQAFYEKVKNEIDAAKYGIVGKADIHVHIFSGLSGGTGAGIFLDVCYMVRDILGESGTVLGYFYMPDVNLAKIPTSQIATRNYVPRNGYASLQELDYCMNILNNKGTFSQEYQDHRFISWNKPPVDLCHLISATDQTARVIPNAYDYAMKVTSEYVLDFLTFNSDTENFSIKSNLSNFESDIAAQAYKKNYGYNLGYLTLGAACASVPFKEINTYLASRVFLGFADVSKCEPSAMDVDNVAIKAWAANDNGNSAIVTRLYESIRLELMQHVTENYTKYGIEDSKIWKDLVGDDHRMVEHYDHQKSRNIGQIVTNTKELMDEKNSSSLVNRFINQLHYVLTDMNRGPFFASGILNATNGHNIFNILDGLRTTNGEYWSLEMQQKERRWSDYEYTREEFHHNKPKKSRYLAYENALINLDLHEQTLAFYEKLDELLMMLTKQLKELSENYYNKLTRIFADMIDTFDANYRILVSEKEEQSGFVKPLITVSEVKNVLDQEVNKIDMFNTFGMLVNYLTSGEVSKEWDKEDKLAKLVTEFFIKHVFSQFAGRTIETYLEEKYDCKGDALVNEVYKEWMQALNKESVALFYHNSSIYPLSSVQKIEHITVPSTSNIIQSAAYKIAGETGGLKVSVSGVKDRILFMKINDVFPMSAYANLKDYERLYYEGYTKGRHYYENKEEDKFTDWRQLPAVIPVSLIDQESAGLSHELKERIKKQEELYNKVLRYHLIKNKAQDDSILCRVSHGAIEKIHSYCNAKNEEIETLKNNGIDAVYNNYLVEIGEIKDKLKNGEYLEETDISVFWEGYSADIKVKERIIKDNFCLSPVIQLEASKILKDIGDIEKKLDKLIEILNAVKSNVESSQSEKQFRKEYFNALFTGLVKVEGRVIKYIKNNKGLTKEYVLSEMDEDKFPYCSISVYQGFKNFSLLDEETREAIKKNANIILNGTGEELQEYGKTLKTAMNEKQFNVWYRRTEDFNSERKEIEEFLEDLKVKFDDFCDEYITE